jgi:hypothetical protein
MKDKPLVGDNTNNSGGIKHYVEATNGIYILTLINAGIVEHANHPYRSSRFYYIENIN